MAEDATSDLWASLDGAANAEPISAEDDLIIRMSAVSKVRKAKGAKPEKPARGTGPSKSIGKRRSPKPRRRSEGMKD